MDLSSEISKGPDFEKTENEKNGQQNKEKGHCIPSFISKAYEILEKDEHSDIILWGETGNNFYVKNIKQFEEKILPIYFRHKNFASFVRQLNMYDFHKIRGEQKHIFEHKLFKKGAHYLLQHIKRKCFKKSKQDEGQDNIQDYAQEQQVKPKKPVLQPSIITNTKQDLAVKQRNLQKEKEKQKLYQIMTQERSKIRKKNLELMQQIIMNLRDKNFQSEKQIRQQINKIKFNPKYKTLHGKYYVYQIYKQLKQSLYEIRPRNTVEDLEQLSIEEDIIYNDIENPSRIQITSLTNFQTQNFMKSSHHTIKNIYGQQFFSRDMF